MPSPLQHSVWSRPWPLVSSDLENLFSNASWHDEYLCKVSSKSLRVLDIALHEIHLDDGRVDDLRTYCLRRPRILRRRRQRSTNVYVTQSPNTQVSQRCWETICLQIEVCRNREDSVIRFFHTKGTHVHFLLIHVKWKGFFLIFRYLHFACV